jgi:acyl-CoA oxidase
MSHSRGLSDPRLLPFLPAVYLAWRDGELTARETSSLCHLVATSSLEVACRELLGGWLDAEHPPSALELHGLLDTIARAGSALDPARGRTLSELANDLARHQGGELTAPERQALTLLEGAFGLSGVEVGRGLLLTSRPEPAEDPESHAGNVAEWVRWLDGEHGAARRVVRRLLALPGLTPPAEANRTEFREWTLTACRILAAHGLGALALPREYGGAEDPGAFVATFETLAYGDLSLVVKFGVQFGLFGGSILELGTEPQHRQWLAEIARLDLPGCFAMTETGHGSNVAEIETTATFDPGSDELILHTPRPSARKDYIGNAACHGRMATVFAQLEVLGRQHGVHAVVVPLRDDDGQPLAGVTLEDCGAKLGLNGVDNGRLSFDHVRVPRTHLLDRFAQIDREGHYTSAIASPNRRFFTMLGTLVGGRVSVAAAALAASKRGLTLALRYASRRRQFGPAGEPERRLLDYPAHQRRLLGPLAAAFALHFAVRELAARYVAGKTREDPELETRAAVLKALATAHATATLQQCREACGGQGYLAVNHFAALKADTDVFTTFEGDNTVLLQLVAKHLLAGYREQFGRLDAGVLFRHFFEHARAAVVERNPFATHRADSEHLLDPEFHLAAFRWREHHLVETLALRLRKRLARGLDPFEALVDCQDHALQAAQAHGERLTLEAFERGTVGAPESLRSALEQLRGLFALTTLERERGFYLETGYLAADKSKAIRKEADRLMRELAPRAVALTDAFGIPEVCLDAPIARR